MVSVKNKKLYRLKKVFKLPLLFLTFIYAIIYVVELFNIGFSYQQTKSMPEGIYLDTPVRDILRGDDIIFTPSMKIEALMIKRGYLSKSTKLLKKVVASIGDIVCIENDRVFISNIKDNYRLNAPIYQTDTKGRNLPKVHLCRRLVKGEYFVMGISNDYSFDSRYFGVIKKSQILSKAELLWKK